MTSLDDLRALDWTHADNWPAFAIDYKPTARGKMRRVVRFAPGIQQAASDFQAIIEADYPGGEILGVTQLSGPVRVYKLRLRKVA